MNREQKIISRIKEHYNEALKRYDESRIVGVFCQGSPNYNLDYEKSDIDTKLILTPSLEDIIFNRKPISTTHILDNEEHLDAKDIRLYINTFKKQNINFLEILFTPFKIVNPLYAKWWNKLEANRERIARYNEYQAVKAMKGVAMEKYRAMEHPYPSKVDIIAEYGYDGKQVSHLLRIEDYLRRYINGHTYEACLIPSYNARPRIMEYKKQEVPLAVARIEASESIERIKQMADSFTACNANQPDPYIDELFNSVQRDIVKFAIALELVEEEYFD